MKTIGTKIEVIKSLRPKTGSIRNLLVAFNETQNQDESKTIISY